MVFVKAFVPHTKESLSVCMFVSWVVVVVVAEIGFVVGCGGVKLAIS